MPQLSVSVSVNELGHSGYSMSVAGEFTIEDITELKHVIEGLTTKVQTVPTPETGEG